MGGVGGEKNGAGKHHEQEHGFVIVLEFQRKKKRNSSIKSGDIYEEPVGRGKITLIAERANRFLNEAHKGPGSRSLQLR